VIYVKRLKRHAEVYTVDYVGLLIVNNFRPYKLFSIIVICFLPSGSKEGNKESCWEETRLKL